MFFESKETFVKSFLFKEKQVNNIVNLDGSFEFMRFTLENDTRLVSNYKHKKIFALLFQYENNLDNHIKIVSHLIVQLLVFRYYYQKYDKMKNKDCFLLNDFNCSNVDEKTLNKIYEIANVYVNENLEEIKEILLGIN